MKQACFLILLICSAYCKAQVNISTGTYSQNFGTANISSWTNNSTFPGWYISGTFQGNVNLSGSANSYNSGGFYAYNCGGDSKIGSRASSSASNLYSGVVLRNMTGQTIRSIRVSYTGYQMTLAQNGGNINTIMFDYIVSTAAPAITASGGVSVPALNFQQLQNSTASGSSQLNWYPCTQSRDLTACIPVTIANSSYILLRWRDVDDTGNDHHMAIDDIEVSFDMTGGTCAVFLPVELLYFNASYNGSEVDLEWATASEKDNSHFTVERSPDGLDFEPLLERKATGDRSTKAIYKMEDKAPPEGISYYRLKQTDRNGTSAYSPIVSVNTDPKALVSIFPNPTNTGLISIRTGLHASMSMTVIDAMGQTVLEQRSESGQEEIDIGERKGIYTIIVRSGNKVSTQRVIRY